MSELISHAQPTRSLYGGKEQTHVTMQSTDRIAISMGVLRSIHIEQSIAHNVYSLVI